ncbi:MAG: hypothetical protein J6N49_05605 [Alphaproteobacteria bacterium]|nr:hypothetical protein [Alphaproteobacteria bacterium]
MGNYIESRVILGLIILIHLFVGYASGIPCGHINRKVLNGVIITELIAVTAYIIYDNLQTPPYDGWILAIIGYLLVYGLILMTWAAYLIYTVLDKDKVYEMTIRDHVRFMNNDYFRGTVMADNRKVKVFLPYSKELEPKDKTDKKRNVKYDNVLRGNHILVKLI